VPILRLLSAPLCIVVFAAALSSAGWAKDTGLVFVSNEKTNNLIVIDPKTNKVVKDLKTSRRPRDMHFNADHSRLYVACGDDDVIDVIDVAKLEVIGKLATGPSPETFAMDETRRRIYVSNEEGSSLSILDMDQNIIIQEVPTGAEPEGVFISEDGHHVYVTSEVGDLIHLIDADSGNVEQDVVVGTRPRRFAATAAKNEFGSLLDAVDTDGAVVITKHDEPAAVLFSYGRVNRVLEKNEPNLQGLTKKVDALISMETSAARNAGLPIVARGKTPYIYTSYYEGHSCSPYMYADSWVPDQQVAPVIDLFVGDKKAKTFFLIGSDYAYGRGMLGFSRAYIEKQGGKIVGEEYNPMDASDWTAIISKVRQANPDALILATAGGAPNVTLTKQYKAAGISALIGNIGVDEGTAKSMGTDAEGVYMSASYVSSLDTPANQKFLAAMKAKFGEELKTPNDLSVPEYEAIYLYKAAVEKVGSTKESDVLKALAEVSFEGPRGLIKMDKQRHAALTMYLGQVQGNGSVKVVKSFKDVDPGNQCPALK